MRGRNRNIFYFILLAGLLAIIWASYKSFNTIAAPQDKTTADLIAAADAHQIDHATIKSNGTEITWDYQGNHYKTIFRDTFQIEQILRDDKINFNTEAPSSSNLLLSVILPNVILFLVIGGFMWYMLRQTQSGNNQAISFGRSRARLLTGDKPAVTFNDVAGVEEAKQELTEIVEFLKFPEKFTALGARIPKGVLMVGPPGTGKTLLSKAGAGHAGVPFFSIPGPEFVEMFVGVGASRVRDLFDQAKKNSPCIVFVDEIDAVGRQRGAGLGGGHDEREQTLNQLLVEMDGFDTNTHVIVIAATNRPDVLDPALLRPGRFDRHVTLDRPDIKGRRQILDVHARNKPLDSTVDLDVLARQTPGFSGADLANLINQIAGIMGGRVAEEIVFVDITSGAENDIQRATQLARRMVTQWGMSDKLGTVTMGHKEELVFLGRDLGEQRNYSEEIAALIDEEIRSIVDHGYQTAKGVLTKQRSKMDAVVERLKIVETIDGKELDQILNREEPQAPAAASSSAS